MAGLVFSRTTGDPDDGALRLGAEDAPPRTGLVFRRAADGSAKLQFGWDGDAGGGTAQDADIAIDAGFAADLPGAITLAVATGLQVDAGFAADLPATVGLLWDNNVSRPTVGQTSSHWQDTAPRHRATRGTWRQAAVLQPLARSHWQDAAPIATSLRVLWRDTLRTQRALRAAFEQARRLPGRPLRGRYQETERLRSDTQAAFEQARRLPANPLAVHYQETYRDRQARAGTRFEQARTMATPVASNLGNARRLPHPWGTHFQTAWPPRPGMWLRPVPPGGRPPCYDPARAGLLVFANPWTGDGHLLFVCERAGPGPQPGETTVVPIKEVYLTINSAVLVRLDNGHAIPTTAMSMSLDVDSWTWGFSASVPGSALSDVHPNSNGDPVVVQATINGTAFRFILERVSRDRTFNTSQLRVSGRGVGAELDAPYAAQMAFGNTQARTTRQLLDDILTHNGVSIGWDVGLWQPTDWLVPAGVFSHSGTYASALNAVVGAAGAYLQPHNTARTLDVRLRYPTPSWQWASVTPQFELPAAVTTQEGFEWVDKPVYNRVFVTGQEHGVNGQYTRAGTAGDLVAPAVVDPLITHADAARQRGRAVLSDTGRIATVTLRLPVLTETGIIKPGSFVRYSEGGNTHMGLTRGVSVAVGMPAIYQTLTLETHVEPF